MSELDELSREFLLTSKNTENGLKDSQNAENEGNVSANTLMNKTNTLKYSSSTVNVTGNSHLKNENSCPNIHESSQDVSQDMSISRSMSNLFKVSKIKTNNDDNSKIILNDMTDDHIDFSDDSDDSIIVSGFKDKNSSFNRINIMTMDQSFKRSDTSSSLNQTAKSSGTKGLKQEERKKEAPKFETSCYPAEESEISVKNDISGYSSRTKSNVFSKDESSFLCISDDMITIEETYKEAEGKMTPKLATPAPLPQTYKINHMEMNVIEEQDDEEEKSCGSSIRVSNNLSGYHSNDPYSYNSNISKENKKQRESFETFGQKSLAGAIHALKSESRESRIDEEVEHSHGHDDRTGPTIAPTFDTVEENKSQNTEEAQKKHLETDDSTDISAQITKRTNKLIGSEQKEEGRHSSLSINGLNMDSISKFPGDGTLTKESQNSERSSFTKSNKVESLRKSKEGYRESRIVIQEYINEIQQENRIRTISSRKSDTSESISENCKGEMDMESQFQGSLRQELKQTVKDIMPESNNELAISSILEHSGNNNETDILEYCTPNYATNTSKLFSTKERDFLPPPLSSAKGSSEEKMYIDRRNMESFSLGPGRSPTSKLNSRQASQKLVEELRSLEEENDESSINCPQKELTEKDLMSDNDYESENFRSSEHEVVQDKQSIMENTDLVNLTGEHSHSGHMRKLYTQMQAEKEAVQARLDIEHERRINLEQEVQDLKTLIERKVEDEAEISCQLSSTKSKLVTLSTKFSQKESQLTTQIQSLQKDYTEQLDERDSRIEFLQQRVSKTIEDLQKEIDQREEIIQQRVSVVKKQREDDLRTFIESKEDIERKVQQERDQYIKKYKERVQMDLEFKAFQNYGIKEVELDEATLRFEREKEEYMKQKEEEMEQKLAFLQDKLTKQYEIKKLENVKSIHKEVQDNFNKQLKLEKQRLARDYKGQISEQKLKNKKLEEEVKKLKGKFVKKHKQNLNNTVGSSKYVK
ncbi:unnamed protein product [Moneuplotes crassus]|uniref:Uncharacterized protein n=1 Tax=Euplotes crassus TaxID=5936 RepID=A0AAD2D309_EUPCR|nr:unnamed protein product [Moneuplotes crassus]